MKKLYSTTMVNVGGRAGEVTAPDNSLALKIAPPGSDAAGATNPEQLFAAGYSSCFNSALEMVLKQANVTGKSTITAIVSLYEKEPFDYVVGVELEGHIDGLEADKTEEMLKKAHEVCPYSKATRGNIEVTLKAV
ncbi:MAG: organic hydroperoxide resistance protein [Ruminococcaceae bacterium]|nr:organic hydroperoxide resistance protein [Oscillospiraceae bacterium]